MREGRGKGSRGGGTGREGEGRKENILNGSRVDISILVGQDVLNVHIETHPLSSEETE